MTGAGRQALVLLLIGTVIGFSANLFRGKPLPFSGSLDPPPAEPGADLPVASPEEALDAWENGAFFLDVRDLLDFEDRRIAGAFSLDATSFDDRYFEVVAGLGSEPLVVYGAGPDSFTVRQTAVKLVELGHENVRVTIVGVDGLIDSGLDAASGPEGP